MESFSVHAPPPPPGVLAAIEDDERHARQALVERELRAMRARTETRSYERVHPTPAIYEQARRLLEEHNGDFEAALAAWMRENGWGNGNAHTDERGGKPPIEHGPLGRVLGVR
ncbi:UBA domain-containing protein [Mycobacterium seoulense]|uniref:Uncharacterized protein n=1 Tax=Mycobacterium seoulense TaxID=386911 RepID=A0A7I7NWK9_9MYCO|nr:ubiquitin-associated-like domain-containing protein [Mycobacterium seoulense]MCV7436077.1 hypothetical protein [Mycobacterium seoulense]BBY01046.1 hypothetical protein MSEO_15450 [Mycobacterium seoulense]